MDWLHHLDAERILRISDDALVIYVGLAAQLAACFGVRVGPAHPGPLGVALAAVIAATAAQGIEGLHGIAVGMAAPLFLFAVARLAPGLFFRR